MGRTQVWQHLNNWLATALRESPEEKPATLREKYRIEHPEMELPSPKTRQFASIVHYAKQKLSGAEKSV